MTANLVCRVVGLKSFRIYRRSMIDRLFSIMKYGTRGGNGLSGGADTDDPQVR